mgnify:CR=1 FL=1
MKYVALSVTIVFPLYESIRGYIKIRDAAWFLHPILSFIMLFAYGASEFRWFIKNFMKSLT